MQLIAINMEIWSASPLFAHFSAFVALDDLIYKLKVPEYQWPMVFKFSGWLGSLRNCIWSSHFMTPGLSSLLEHQVDNEQSEKNSPTTVKCRNLGFIFFQEFELCHSSSETLPRLLTAKMSIELKIPIYAHWSKLSFRYSRESSKMWIARFVVIRLICKRSYPKLYTMQTNVGTNFWCNFHDNRKIWSHEIARSSATTETT